MTSEKLRVHYEGDLLNPGPGSGLRDTVRRLVATGKVHIVSGSYLADADEPITTRTPTYWCSSAGRRR